jgi:hypothetical protein|tara:strand:- start:65 stop:622 length:558 start_codon:yes stop_codon:yes gene_type:complete
MNHAIRSVASKLRILFLTIICFSCSATLLASVPKIVEVQIEDAQLVGEARMKVLFFNLYDIALFAPKGTFNSSLPFALELNYLREIKARVIAELSAEEMRRQGNSEVDLARWYRQMEFIFPDVKKGTSLIGIFDQAGETHFYQDNELIGTIADRAFSESFSAIWLGPDSRVPKIKRILTGEQPIE